MKKSIIALAALALGLNAGVQKIVSGRMVMERK